MLFLRAAGRRERSRLLIRSALGGNGGRRARELNNGLWIIGGLLRHRIQLGDHPGLQVDPVEEDEGVEHRHEDDGDHEEDLEEPGLKLGPKRIVGAAKVRLIPVLPEPPDGPVHPEDCAHLGFLRVFPHRVGRGPEDESLVHVEDEVHVVVHVDVVLLHDAPQRDREGDVARVAPWVRRDPAVPALWKGGGKGERK